MTSPAAQLVRQDTLYITDAELIRRLGYCEKVGYRILHELQRARPNRRPYPQIDPIFGKRFWPEVLQWHLDYHHVRALNKHENIADMASWQENFNAPAPRKTEKSGRSRAQMASA